MTDTTTRPERGHRRSRRRRRPRTALAASACASGGTWTVLVARSG